MTSPPAALMAARAASDNFFRFSNASLSRRAFVFELPLGATPLKIFVASLGVKLTKLIASEVEDAVHCLVEFRIDELLGFRRDPAKRDCFEALERGGTPSANEAAIIAASALTEAGRDGGVGGTA